MNPRLKRSQPGPDSSVVDRLKFVADEIGVELIDLGVTGGSEIQANELQQIIQKLENVNPNYILNGTGSALLSTIKSRRIKDYSGINQRVREVRIKNNLTQGDFAAILGYARPTIASLEQNRMTISFAGLRILKKKFGVSYDYIIDGVEPDPITGNIADLKRQLEECRANNLALRKIINNL